MELADYLKYMTDHDGSDLYLSAAAPASVKINGKLTAINNDLLQTATLEKIAKAILSTAQWQEFLTQHEMNLALDVPNIGRFRVNLFKQRGDIGLVIRAIKSTIPNAASLGLPAQLTDVIMQKRGLVLFVGATGSGKSTSLAALIDHRNRNAHDHIITIEDPIEFIHPNHSCIIEQREVGIDTHSYSEALKNTLRQAPDVILIGEIRAQETMEHALAFAETGHLCLSTLHANNANQAIERIINFFPEEKHNQIYLELSLNLLAVISQRLIPTTDNKRVAAIEILLATPLVKEMIKRRDIAGIKEVMEKSSNAGMQTFDQALFALYQAQRITEQEALRQADSENNLRLKINLARGIQPDLSQLSLKRDDEA